MSKPGRIDRRYASDPSEFSGLSVDAKNQSGRLQATKRFSETGTHQPPRWVDPAKTRDDNRSLLLRTAILQVSAELFSLAAKREASTCEPCLIFGSGKAQGTAIPLLPMQQETSCTWIIGSEANCDILMNDVGISSLHAMLTFSDNQWSLIDQQSASGTFVNGKPCLKRVLNDGDQLQFGHVKCTFHLPEHHPSRKNSRRKRWLQAVKTAVTAPFTLLGRRNS